MVGTLDDEGSPKLCARQSLFADVCGQDMDGFSLVCYLPFVRIWVRLDSVKMPLFHVMDFVQVLAKMLELCPLFNSLNTVSKGHSLVYFHNIELFCSFQADRLL